MVKCTALVFTYRGDEVITPICVDFIKETLGKDVHIVVADDGLNAVFQDTRNKLIEMGVDYRQTSWPRFGNLLGPDHLTGATDLMAQLAKDCDIIVKIDPDACLLRRDWIDRLYLDDKAVMTSAYKTSLNYMMGNSYAVKASACADLAKDAKNYPGWNNCFEDYEIGQRLARLAGGDPTCAIRYPCSLDGGFILTNPWDFNVTLCLERCRVYCSGFTYGSTPPEQRQEYKNKQAEVHSMLLKEFKLANQQVAQLATQALANEQNNDVLLVDTVPETLEATTELPETKSKKKDKNGKVLPEFEK